MITRFLPLFAIILVEFSHAQNSNQEWITRRGDETPGLYYNSAVIAKNGRTIALSGGGGLMISNDRGATWTFDQIKVGGAAVEGLFTRLYQVPGGSLIAIMKRLEESTEGHFNYIVRTYFVSSNDNGSTWSLASFPENFATFRRNGQKFYGVNIENLHMGPGGQLLAYGTTSGTNQPGFVFWSIGGAIFRQVGNTWEQAHFGNGPVGKIAEAGGRAVAAVYNGVLDSADGAGWNGYTFPQAKFTLDGQPMDFDTQERMRILDIEVVDGTYIAQGATFIPFRNIPGIDTNIADGVFKLVSPTPFSGARNWSAFTQPRYYGPLTKVGGRILSAGPGGVFSSDTVGGGYTAQDETVATNGNTLAVSGTANVVAVANSESTWNSGDGGSSWSKVWDKDPGPNLRPIAVIDGAIFARGDRDELWTSRDGGESWQLNDGDFDGFGTIVKVGDDALIAPTFGSRTVVSTDGGNTWEFREITDGGALRSIIRLASGRLLATAKGRDVFGKGKFYLSDDEGETWRAVNAGLGFGNEVAEAVQTPTGRIIVPTSQNFPFFPRLTISDDNGETWRHSPVLQRVPGLNLIAGTVDQTTIEPIAVRVSPTGRVIMMSDDEIITSDDDGESWITRRSLEAETPGVFNRFRLSDLIQVGTRWIAIGSSQPDRVTFPFLFISEDDGSTWGKVPFETNQSNTNLSKLALTATGRLIITGTNGSVFTKDFDLPTSAKEPEQEIREGNVESIVIPRPAIDGMIEARYGTISRSATSEVDFVPAGGILTWAAGDLDAKTISIQTIDNRKPDPARDFLVQLSFETADGLFGTIETPVTIIDDDGPSNPGLLFDNATSFRTSENGQAAEIRISLWRRPTADVVITISGIDPSEGFLATHSRQLKRVTQVLIRG